MVSTIKLKEVLGDQQYFEQFPLKQYNTFRTGGSADIAIFPKNEQEISFALSWFNENHIPYYIMGNGSNLLISDDGVDGAVIILKKFREIAVNESYVHAHAGDLLSEVSHVAMKHALSGLEFAAGIPGSVGGAIYMNAGAYGSEMKDVIQTVRAMNSQGEILTIPASGCGFGYRKSVFQENGLFILSATFHLRKCELEQIQSQMQALNEKRREKQPIEYPSAGSTFKRPEGYFAGKLIEDAGLKGRRIGGAMVSEKHAGFIINYNHATTSDILELIHLVQNTVDEKFGVRLEPEIKYLGRNM